MIGHYNRLPVGLPLASSSTDEYSLLGSGFRSLLPTTVCVMGVLP